jgi:hypothetical protein
MPSCSDILTARKNRVLAVSGPVDRKNASCSVQLSREAGTVCVVVDVGQLQ